MNNTIALPTLREAYPAEPTYRTERTDYDIPEIAIGFGRRFGNQKIPKDFGTTTLGAVTYRRVDPLREPFQVADRRLQARLEALCETLSAKY
ncbi:MAG TPA: hypothetical protein VFD13_05445 [Candidatus Kapabacteria bacterium]|nr:hypothetical protein [Candidatus Kapabacteria bacterium]